MICCIGGQGDALDLVQHCRWVSTWGLVSLYRVLALQRATFALVGWELRAMGLRHSRDYFMDPQHRSMIAHVPPFEWGWCTWFTIPTVPHTCTIHLACVLRSRWGCVSLQETKGRANVIILALTDGLQEFSIHLETHEDILVPPHPLRSTIVICLDNKGPTPYPLCLRSILASWHTLCENSWI